MMWRNSREFPRMSLNYPAVVQYFFVQIKEKKRLRGKQSIKTNICIPGLGFGGVRKEFAKDKANN